MLNSLYIKNFRCLEEFQIKSLKQVNLITGKNNTGKSTILEALMIYASNRPLIHISDILRKRGEYYTKEDDANPLDGNIRTLSALFTNRHIGFKKSDIIQIGENIENSIRLSFVKYMNLSETTSGSSAKIFINPDQPLFDSHLSKIGFRIFKEESENELNGLIELDSLLSKRGYRVLKNYEPILCVRTADIFSKKNGKFFDNIALTEREQNVVEALRIIEPETERIAFVGDSNEERTAIIKLSDKTETLPIQAMGDGINRILTIILALVNCNGYLLIDEFENGLHYSIQEKLWKIILSLAEKLNIQVFATTHSNDSIYSFEKALNSSGNTVEGKLIRLDNKNGKIKEVEFSPEEIKIAEEQNIEIR